MLGQQITENYIVQKFLGEGGMSKVYMGVHSKLGHSRKVAIKVLHNYLAASDEVRIRFKNEANTLAQLEHDNIVRFIDYHEKQNEIFLVMQYIEGIPLNTFIREKNGPIPENKTIDLMLKVLKAVEYAHKKFFIHRDIKPSNFMITNDDKKIMILDFGIAKIVNSMDYELTNVGDKVGTLMYMSPEQVRGEVLDHRSDIYSLGMVLFEMLTGQYPFKKDNITEYILQTKIDKEPLPDPRSIYQHISQELCDIIQKATEKDRANRYATCSEFYEELYKLSDEYKQGNGQLMDIIFSNEKAKAEAVSQAKDLTMLENFKILIQNGDYAFNEGKYQEALVSYQDASAINHESEHCRYRIGECEGLIKITKAKQKKKLAIFAAIFIVLCISGYYLYYLWAISNSGMNTPDIKTVEWIGSCRGDICRITLNNIDNKENLIKFTYTAPSLGKEYVNKTGSIDKTKKTVEFELLGNGTYTENDAEYILKSDSKNPDVWEFKVDKKILN